jgi:hypothetical protein
MEQYAVALEMGPKRRVFAQVLAWIGWCRAGKDEMTALNQLVTTASNYAQVVERAGLTFVTPSSIEAFKIVESMPGTATTDFGAPSVLLTSDREPLEEEDIERHISLLTACWSTFDDVLHRIPADLHDVKPERARSPSALRLHLLETEQMHLSAFGPAFRQPDPAHMAEQEAAVREQFLAELRAVACKESFAPRRRYGFAWTPRFAVRRSAWHALDHAWELQERLDR